MSDTFQVNTADQPITAITDIATDVADALKGYREMETRASGDLLPIIQRLLTLHEAHATEIFETLDRLGGRPDKAGSVMGLVHQAVATGRDWFDALDASAESAIIRGEERLIEQYGDAIKGAESDEDIRTMLENQRAALQAQVDALRD